MRADGKLVLVGVVLPFKTCPPVQSADVVPETWQFRLLVLQAKNVRTLMSLDSFFRQHGTAVLGTGTGKEEIAGYHTELHTRLLELPYNKL